MRKTGDSTTSAAAEPTRSVTRLTSSATGWRGIAETVSIGVPSRSVGYIRAKRVRTRSARRWTVTPTSSHQPISRSHESDSTTGMAKIDVVHDPVFLEWIQVA